MVAGLKSLTATSGNGLVLLMDIDTLAYGDPTKEDKSLMSRKLEVLPNIKNPERMVPVPDKNSSLETEDDLIAIASLSDELSVDEKEIIDAEDINFVESTFIPYLEQNNIDYDKDEIEAAIEDVASIVMNVKYRFNRPRPAQLADFHNVKISPREGTSADSPSYPSGHSAQASFLARMLGDSNPKHKVNLLEMGDAVGINRLKGNFHYPADHEAGVDFGKKLYDLYKVSKASDTILDKARQTKYI